MTIQFTRKELLSPFPSINAKHSLFGAFKAAADLLVHEYGRYFGLESCSLCGGCLAGPKHSGVELHGFLSYSTRCNHEECLYRIYAYKGKQVRDNIRSVDAVRFVHAFFEKPKFGKVNNFGGGRANSISILEAFESGRSHRQADAFDISRRPPRWRPHLLHQRPF
jgi:CDP-paratose 2-epimerase